MATMHSDGASLTDRRRAQTRLEIQLAAIDLFETQGVDATTIAEIADAAAVSARTVFRYFEAKELAALPWHESLAERVRNFAPVDDTPGFVLRQVEELLTEETLSDLPGGLDSRRLAMLFSREPRLRETAAAQLQRIMAALEAKLSEHCPSLPRFAARMIADVATTTWHTSWEVLGHRYQANEAVTPLENYREHCQRLREITR